MLANTDITHPFIEKAASGVAGANLATITWLYVIG